MLSAPFPTHDYTNANISAPFQMYRNLPNELRSKIHHGRQLATSTLSGALTGTAIGSVAAAQTENDPKIGTVVGGVSGAVIGGVSAYALQHPIKTLSAIGTPTYNLGSGIVNFATGGTAKGLLKGLGAGATVAGIKIAEGAGTVGEIALGAAAKTGIRMAGMASSFVKEDANAMLGYKLNAGGKALAVGGAAVKGVADAFTTLNKLHQGAIEPGLVRATPQPTYSSMMNNAGATGDLVFALHHNRRG